MDRPGSAPVPGPTALSGSLPNPASAPTSAPAVASGSASGSALGSVHTPSLALSGAKLTLIVCAVSVALAVSAALIYTFIHWRDRTYVTGWSWKVSVDSSKDSANLAAASGAVASAAARRANTNHQTHPRLKPNRGPTSQSEQEEQTQSAVEAAVLAAARARARFNHRRVAWGATPREARVLRCVVGLTSIPSRLNELEPTLTSLLTQPFGVDQVYLCLPTSYARFPTWSGELPEWLVTLQQKSNHSAGGSVGSALRVVRCPDYGPLTKLVPVLQLERQPGTWILLADDDQLYPSGCFDALFREALKHAQSTSASHPALGFRGLVVSSLSDESSVRTETRELIKSATFAGSDTWQVYQGPWCFTGRHASRTSRFPPQVDVLETYSGVLYRRDHFGQCVLAARRASQSTRGDTSPLGTSLPSLPRVVGLTLGSVAAPLLGREHDVLPRPDTPCWYCDDLWLSRHVARRGFELRLVEEAEGVTFDTPCASGDRACPIVQRLALATRDPLAQLNLYEGTRNGECWSCHTDSAP